MNPNDCFEVIIRKDMRTVWSLIETESAKIKETEKERTECRVGNPPLSRTSNNLDT